MVINKHYAEYTKKYNITSFIVYISYTEKGIQTNTVPFNIRH